MKSAVFYGVHDLRIEDHPLPVLGSEDVMIQVKAHESYFFRCDIP